MDRERKVPKTPTQSPAANTTAPPLTLLRDDASNRDVAPSSLKTDPNWLDTKGAAALLMTSPGQIRNLVSEGRIPYFKPFGRLRFKRTDLERLIEGSRKGA